MLRSDPEKLYCHLRFRSLDSIDLCIFGPLAVKDYRFVKLMQCVCAVTTQQWVLEMTCTKYPVTYYLM